MGKPEALRSHQGVLRREYLNDVTVVQNHAQFHWGSIDLGSNRVVTDFGVDGIRKVHCSSADRERDGIAARREDINLLLVHLEAK